MEDFVETIPELVLEVICISCSQNSIGLWSISIHLVIQVVTLDNWAK